jgi:hypothetical protein
MAAVSTRPAQVDGLSTPQDLANTGPDVEQGGEPIAQVTIAVMADGSITVDDQPVGSLDEALQTAGQSLVQMSQQGALEASDQAQADAQASRSGNEDAQAIWDELVAQRANRGNT